LLFSEKKTVLVSILQVDRELIFLIQLPIILTCEARAATWPLLLGRDFFNWEVVVIDFAPAAFSETAVKEASPLFFLLLDSFFSVSLTLDFLFLVLETAEPSFASPTAVSVEVTASTSLEAEIRD
jgi:hypothetical protein